jgi:hypothetical protein
MSFALELSLALAVSSFAITAFTPVASARSFAPAPTDRLSPERQVRFAPPMLDRAAVRAKLLANRKANIARFHAYRVAGVYPSNVFTDSLANIWQDEQGHFCAAATIIRMSGETALVDRIAEENNFFRIADVSQGPVMDWILTSGLTQAELVMIQKPFMPVAERPDAYRPTVETPDGPVTQLTTPINPKLRANETRRLAKLYRQIEQKLVKAQRANLERAVDRLMQRPDLVRQLLSSSSSSPS